MLGRFKSDVRRILWLVRVMRRRGFALPAIVAVHLPLVLAGRLYGRAARALNGRGPWQAVNRARFAAFQRRHADRLGGHYYAIVMPGTLHFLRPCLDRVPDDVVLFLVSNGARRWERARLQREYPHRPMVELATLPGSSLVHGDAIDLMLAHNDRDFGILDHDLYLFDPTIFDRARPGPGECAFALFAEVNRSTGRHYPETYFLHFNAGVMHALCSRYGVDARIWRVPPPRAAERLAAMGWAPRWLWKETQDYFDTLQLLFVLAQADGVPVRLGDPDEAVVHVGGTSMGSPRTKDLDQLYIHRRFIDLADDAEIARRYRHKTTPWRSAEQIRERMDPRREEWRVADGVDRLIERLRVEMPARGGAPCPS